MDTASSNVAFVVMMTVIIVVGALAVISMVRGDAEFHKIERACIRIGGDQIVGGRCAKIEWLK